jgi:hypothetical protein
MSTGSAGQVSAGAVAGVQRQGQASEEVTIDLTGSSPTRTSVFTRPRSPRILRSSPRVGPSSVVHDLALRAPTRHVHLGHDIESPLVWQRVAEAVRALAPGDVIVLETRDLGDLPFDLIDFLRHAVVCAARRGGTLTVEPPYGPLSDVLRLAPLWPDFGRERSYL